jgi:hypothetical protein
MNEWPGTEGDPVLSAEYPTELRKLSDLLLEALASRRDLHSRPPPIGRMSPCPAIDKPASLAVENVTI